MSTSFNISLVCNSCFSAESQQVQSFEYCKCGVHVFCIPCLRDFGEDWGCHLRERVLINTNINWTREAVENADAIISQGLDRKKIYPINLSKFEDLGIHRNLLEFAFPHSSQSDDWTKRVSVRTQSTLAEPKIAGRLHFSRGPTLTFAVAKHGFTSIYWGASYDPKMYIRERAIVISQKNHQIVNDVLEELKELVGETLLARSSMFFLVITPQYRVNISADNLMSKERTVQALMENQRLIIDASENPVNFSVTLVERLG